MKLYQLTYLISPELLEEEARQNQEEISFLITQGGGVVVEIKLSGKKISADFGKKQEEASLTVLDFQIEPEKLPDLDKKLREGGRILRYLITSKPYLKKMTMRKSRKPVEKTRPKEKVEISEIEKKLEEILGK